MKNILNASLSLSDPAARSNKLLRPASLDSTMAENKLAPKHGPGRTAARGSISAKKRAKRS